VRALRARAKLKRVLEKIASTESRTTNDR